MDPDPANAGPITAWCKDYFDALHPYSAGGAYVNFMMDEGQERVQASFRRVRISHAALHHSASS